MRIYDPQAETMTRGEMESLQLERLGRTLELVWESGVPYRDRMEQRGISPADVKELDDLEGLPFSEKVDFRSSYPYGMLAVPLEDVVRIHASSGTTGTRTIVAYTPGDIENWSELVARFATSAGVVPSDIAQVAFTYGLFTGGFGLHYGLERAGATVVPASGGKSALQLELMAELGSTVLVSTPTYALHLAGVADERKYDFSQGNLRLGLFGAEPWSEEVRKRIESTMGISATDNYGLSEVVGPGVAGECELKSGMHIAEDHFLVEVIDPAGGGRLPPGELGELVITTLTREAVPVVRFRTGDLSRVDLEPCDCGRTTARMSKVLGRTDDMLIVRGVNFYPSQVEEALLQLEDVEPHYMIVLDTEGELDTLEVWVEASQDVFSDDTRRMRSFEQRVESHLKSRLNLSARVSLKEPNTIERFEGKARRVIDRRKNGDGFPR